LFGFFLDVNRFFSMDTTTIPALALLLLKSEHANGLSR
jgi:hypothetical protein